MKDGACHPQPMGLGLLRRSRVGAIGLLIGVAAAGGGCGPKKTSQGGAAGSGNGAAGSASGAAGGAATTASGPISTLDDFFAAEGRGYCERLFRCQEGDDDFNAARLVLQTREHCETLLARANATSVRGRDLRAEIAAGRMRLVPEQAQLCVEELSRCNGPSNFDRGACRDMLEGSAELGEACYRNEDCRGDAYCEHDLVCPGQCATRKAEGEPCSRVGECQSGNGYTACLASDSSSGGESTCHTLAIERGVGLGGSCTRRVAGAAALRLCDDALWCATATGGDPSQDVMGVCAKPIADGGPCVDSDDVCATGVCDDSTKQCKPVIIRSSPGESCDQEALIGCDPVAGLGCQGGTCVAAGDGSEGSTCYSGDFQLGCKPGLYCDKPTGASSSDLGTCRALLKQGDACEGAVQCESGACNQVCGDRPCTYG